MDLPEAGLKEVSQHRRYRIYVLAVLGASSILNYYDRNLITILVEPMKRDLHLSDSQIGLLTGFGFALMYSLLGIPVARLADRYGRARLLAVALGLWSLMTVASGRASNFFTMLLARIGVGIGEAGGLPATHALIADYFPAPTRGRALSVIGVCGTLGLSLALAGGGLISEHYGWRVAFLVAGLPGLILSTVLFLTVRDRKPDTVAEIESSSRPPMKLAEVFAALWARRSYVYLCAGLGFAAIGAYGQFAWTPAFLMRTYHMSSGQIGTYYSAVVGPASLVSVFIGGALNDWLMKRDQRWSLWMLAACFAINVPLSLIFFQVHDFRLAMALSLVSAILGALWVAPAYALVQSLAGPSLRAIGAAIFMMIVNIIGLGLGPYATGALSDHLKARFGDASLGLSLCAVTFTCLVGVFFFLIAARSVASDITTAQLTPA
jgi:predicted MFS family arabinose efflux permease